MKILFDTSVLVAALVEAHPMHEQAIPWLRRAKLKEFSFLVPCHTIAELYSVLTTLPIRPRISPDAARRLIKDNVESKALLIDLSASDYMKTISSAAELGLIGGSIYDALIARAACVSGADKLLTFNIDDFRRVWPDGRSIITIP